jgi:hypothetical protein
MMENILRPAAQGTAPSACRCSAPDRVHAADREIEIGWHRSGVEIEVRNRDPSVQVPLRLYEFAAATSKRIVFYFMALFEIGLALRPPWSAFRRQEIG